MYMCIDTHICVIYNTGFRGRRLPTACACVAWRWRVRRATPSLAISGKWGRSTTWTLCGRSVGACTAFAGSLSRRYKCMYLCLCVYLYLYTYMREIRGCFHRIRRQLVTQVCPAVLAPLCAAYRRTQLVYVYLSIYLSIYICVYLCIYMNIFISLCCM